MLKNHTKSNPSMQFMTRILAALALLLLQLVCHAAPPAQEEEVEAKVRKNGELIIIDVSFSVAATPQETWAVLADFEHMSDFVSNLESSKVLSRNGNVLQVAQKGKASRGLLSFAFESVREVELTPPSTIRTRLVSGNMKKLDGLTQIVADGDGTRVSYHGESIPTVWVPPVVGTGFIANEVREQFREMRAEILKRKNAAQK